MKNNTVTRLLAYVGKSKKTLLFVFVTVLVGNVSLLLAPFSYGAVQVRVAEALTLLPVFTPDAVVGVTLGCLLTNLLGSSPIDAVFGTLATLSAAFLTYWMRDWKLKGLPVWATAEITVFFMDAPFSLPALAFNMLTVGLGEVVSCLGLGLLLVKCVEKNRTLGEFLTA